MESQGVDALQSQKKWLPFMKKETPKRLKRVPSEESVELLKKLNALVQNKETSPNKIKQM